MKTKQITDNSNVITIRLKQPYIDAYRFLKEKKLKPQSILKKSGQDALLIAAQKHRFKLVKIKDRYF